MKRSQCFEQLKCLKNNVDKIPFSGFFTNASFEMQIVSLESAEKVSFLIDVSVTKFCYFTFVF